MGEDELFGVFACRLEGRPGWRQRDPLVIVLGQRESLATEARLDARQALLVAGFTHFEVLTAGLAGVAQALRDEDLGQPVAGRERPVGVQSPADRAADGVQGN